jgi:hypothetical protein
VVLDSNVEQLPRVLDQCEVNTNYQLSLQEAQKEERQAPQKQQKKLERLKLKLWLEDGPRQAFQGHGNYDAYNSNVPSFRPSPGQGLPLHNTHILASSEI